MQPATALAFVACLSVLAGCASDPVETVEAFCRDRMDSSRSCTPDCYAAADGAAGVCSEHGRRLFELAEHVALIECGMTCAPGLECPGRPSLIACDCASACLRERSTEYQEAWAAYVGCLDEQIAGTCY